MAKSIEMQPVQSSNIAEVGYDKGSRTLHVNFLGGGQYTYGDVSEDIYNEMINADSVGKFFYKNVRTGFDATKL